MKWFKHTLSALRSRMRRKAPQHIESDHLSRGEKLALTILVAGQVLSIFTWYLGKPDTAATIGAALPWIRLVFAVAASAALDLVVVVTTMGRRDGRRSPWGWATILSAAFFSAAIALDVAGGPSLGAWLHACYAVNIFLFAQHVAQPRFANPPAPVERPVIRTATPVLAAETNAETTERETVRVVSGETTKAYACQACGHELSIGQYGSAKRYGHCRYCKV